MNVEIGLRRREWFEAVSAAKAAGIAPPPFESRSKRKLERQAAREARAAREADRMTTV